MQKDQYNQNEWSDDDLNILISLVNKGMTTHEIYKKYNDVLNRSEHSIQSRIYTLRKAGKITCPKKWNAWTKEQSDLFAQLVERGLSVEEIYSNYNEKLGNRTMGALCVRLSKLTQNKKGRENIQENKEIAIVEEPLFADEEITFKQQKAINTIRYKLGIEFTGKTKRDAYEFIKKYKDESYAIDKQESTCHEVPEVPAYQNTVANELIKAIRENTEAVRENKETVSKGIDAMIRGIAEIKTLLVEINSNSRDIVKTDKDIQEKMHTIQKFGVTVKGMK